MLRILCFIAATVTALCFVASASAAQRLPSAPRATRTDGTINAVIGDASFERAFHRSPVASDPPALRVAVHLHYVTSLLKAAPTGHLPTSIAQRRAQALATLEDYTKHGIFPIAEDAVGYRPIFIDRQGALCAVGYLVAQTAGYAVAKRIDRSHHYDRIAAIQDSQLREWAIAYGFRTEELAMIQPAYPPRPSLSQKVWLQLATDVKAEIARENFAGRGYAGVLNGRGYFVGRHNRWLGQPIVGVSGSYGALWQSGSTTRLGAESDRGASAVYSVHAFIGSQVLLPWPEERHYIIGFTAGVGIDAFGERLSRATTVPVRLYVRRKFTEGAIISAAVGATVANQDRPFAYSFGVTLDRGKNDSPSAIGIGLDAERLGDATYLGLSLRFRSRGNRSASWPSTLW